MTAFSADWLALREPADAAARSLALTRALASSFAIDREVSILDLGAGTGANVRFLIEHLPARQRWVLVDHDAALLSSMPRQMTSWATARGAAVTGSAAELFIRSERLDCRLSTRVTDLRAAVDNRALYDGCDLVTASALLDLVSQQWLDVLAVRCAEHRTRVLCALTYDGRMECSPGEPEDDAIRGLVNRHQLSDKGFGPALGPDAAGTAETHFQRLGYETRSESSDWVLAADFGELQRQLIDGWAQAAAEIDPSQTTMLHGWRTRRLAHVDRGRSRIVVGHTDLVAWPSTFFSELRTFSSGV